MDNEKEKDNDDDNETGNNNIHDKKNNYEVEKKDSGFSENGRLLTTDTGLEETPFIK